MLVVEDNAQVREVVVRSLTRAGYTVLVAGDGEEALALVETHCGSGSGPGTATLRLLITDIILPGMNGRELAVRVEAREPRVRTLYVSGYTETAIVHRGVLPEGMNMLVKPFTPAQLAARVREVLDGEATARSSLVI